MRTIVSVILMLLFGTSHSIAQTMDDEPVLMGRSYYNSQDFDKALSYYNKADKLLMEENDLSNYTMSAFFMQNHDKALEVAMYGLTRHPHHVVFNRMAFFNLTELKRYDEALQYANALFDICDSTTLTWFDYTYYGNAYVGTKQIDKAIEMYEKALAHEDLDNKSKHAGVVKLISDAYKAKENYPIAIKYYKEYLANIDTPTANDLAGLAALHIERANTLKDWDEKNAVLTEADSVYASLVSKHENAIEYATFMRARVNAQMDPDSKLGLAKPYYEKLIELIEPRAEKDATERARIIEAYRYMIAYNFIVKEDKDAAKAFATKLQAIDPENEVAKQILESK